MAKLNVFNSGIFFCRFWQSGIWQASRLHVWRVQERCWLVFICSSNEQNGKPDERHLMPTNQNLFIFILIH